MSYSKRGQTLPLGKCIRGMDILSSGVDRGEVMGLSDQYLAHRFDLLGSGWVRVVHGMSCRGLEGHRFDMGVPVTPDREGRWLAGRVSPANLETAQQLWRLVDEGYDPIDWHLDFKSGYRWPETIWYRDVPVPPAAGADVKVPWELARMQHLPILALAYGYASGGTGWIQGSFYLCQGIPEPGAGFHRHESTPIRGELVLRDGSRDTGRELAGGL